MSARPAEASATTHLRGGAYASLLATFALVVLLAWEITATLRQHQHATPAADWQTAGQALRRLHRAGEPVLVAPEWARPLAYAQLSGVIDLERATLSDLDRFGRVWQLSTRGAQHRWLSDRAPRQAWHFGLVELALYVQPHPAQVLFDFTAAAAVPAGGAEASHAPTVTRLGADLRRPCPRAGARFVCDAETEWRWVGPHLAEVDHRPYRCLYAHPGAGERLVIAYRGVPLGGSLVGYTGIGDFDSRKLGRAPVLLQTFVDDELVASVEHANRAPWTRFVADTQRFAGTSHRVEFVLTTPEQAYRTFCFHVEARQ
ncbi:MAG: hypothetical protein IPG96_03480 [Proteobacteria bacterium]|nr:hypothetical protein [Pseudomonadota bacterium]